MPHAFAFFLTNIGFTPRTSIFSLERLREASGARPFASCRSLYSWTDGTSDLAAALNRVAGIAAVAMGCPAANCDAARVRPAVLRRAASAPGPASSTFTGRRRCRRCAAAARRPARRPWARNTSWAPVISSPEGGAGAVDRRRQRQGPPRADIGVPGPSAIQQRQPAAGGFNSDRSWRIASTRTAGIGASLPLDAGATNDEVCPKAAEAATSG